MPDRYYMRIILALLLCYASVGAQTPIDYQKWQINDSSFVLKAGGTLYNYQDSTGWHAIENDWILNGEGILINWRAVLQTSVTRDGISIVTITWQGNDYTVTQEPIGIAWVNKATWDWDWIDNDLTWITPNVDSNIVHWPGISSGIDYRIRKKNASVEHGVFFKPGFVSAAVAAFDQRPDSADLALCNISRYTFSANIDNPDSVFQRANKRVLKRFAEKVFSLTDQRLRFPGSDTLPRIPVERHEKRINGSIYGAEMVDGSRIKQIHEAYPNATIWHNTSINIEVAASSDDCDKLDASFSTSRSVILAGLGGDGEICDNGNRFLNITIPQGATIDSALMGMVAGGSIAAKANFKAVIHCEDADSASTFSTSGDFTGRTPTSASVAWENVGSWTFEVRYYTPDIKTCVKEVVDRGSWKSGNALVVLIDENGSVDWEDWRIWLAYDYGSPYTDITIGYTVGAPAATPLLDDVHSISGAGKVHDVSDTTKVHHP